MPVGAIIPATERIDTHPHCVLTTVLPNTPGPLKGLPFYQQVVWIPLLVLAHRHVYLGPHHA